MFHFFLCGWTCGFPSHEVRCRCHYTVATVYAPSKRNAASTHAELDHSKRRKKKRVREKKQKTIKVVIIVIFSGLFETHLFRVFNCFSHTFYCVLMSHAKIGHLGL